MHSGGILLMGRFILHTFFFHHLIFLIMKNSYTKAKNLLELPWVYSWLFQSVESMNPTKSGSEKLLGFDDTGDWLRVFPQSFATKYRKGVDSVLLLKILLFSGLIVLYFHSGVFAQNAGSIDPTFNSGKSYTEAGPDSDVNTTVILARRKNIGRGII